MEQKEKNKASLSMKGRIFSFLLFFTLLVLGIFVYSSEKEETACIDCVQSDFTSFQTYSLPTLAIIMGLADGFNPCAMWALVFLIGLTVGLRDKTKLILLVGSFVAASAVLYFLFMTTWLNVFLFMGYVRIVTVIVGICALYMGITYICNFYNPLCKVRKKQLPVFQKMKTLVASPLTLATLLGIVFLAFVVNSVEFLCSWALPVTFTEILALHHLSAFQHYFFILLYDIFFMLDDFILFGLAVFAVSYTGEKYARWSTLVSGLLLLILGAFLLFAPDLLR